MLLKTLYIRALSKTHPYRSISNMPRYSDAPHFTRFHRVDLSTVHAQRTNTERA